NIPSYTSPDAAWIDHWHGLVDSYKLTPTNFGSWVDTTRFYGRDLTAEEGADQLQLDLRLGNGAGLHFGAAQVGGDVLGAGPAPDLGAGRRAVAGPGRRAGRRHLPGDPLADADQAPGDPALPRLHREDRH